MGGFNSDDCKLTVKSPECEIKSCSTGYSGTAYGKISCKAGDGLANPNGTYWLDFQDLLATGESSCSVIDVCKALTEEEIRSLLNTQESLLSAEADISHCVGSLSEGIPCTIEKCAHGFEPLGNQAQAITCYVSGKEASLSITNPFQCTCLKEGPCKELAYCQYKEKGSSCSDGDPDTQKDTCGASDTGECAGSNACASSPCMNGGACDSVEEMMTRHPSVAAASRATSETCASLKVRCQTK